MGTTFIEAEVSSLAGGEQRVRFLVDSGASYSVLPTEVWRGLGLQPERKVAVELADGTRLTRLASECRFALAGQSAHSPVILGEIGDEAILGVVTLEVFGLVLDPLRRELRSMHLRT